MADETTVTETPTADDIMREVTGLCDDAKVTAFIHAEHLPIDPQRFFDWFERHGWATKTGKPLDDWRRMARTWAKHEMSAPPASSPADAGGKVPTVEQIMKANKVDRSVAQDMLDAGLY